MTSKDNAYLAIEKFRKEILDEMVRKLFRDAILSDQDLDFAYFDESEVKVEIPVLNFKTKKAFNIKKNVNVLVSIEITEP